CRDLVTFLSMHAKGNVLHVGLCERTALASLLYGVERNSGHVWAVCSVDAGAMAKLYFAPHAQFTLIESEDTTWDDPKKDGIPEELDLIYVHSHPVKRDIPILLSLWGYRIKPSGMIVVLNVKADPAIAKACEDYAKAVGMKFRVRQAQA